VFAAQAHIAADVFVRLLVGAHIGRVTLDVELAVDYV
jgi:hypothetical protein